MTQTDVVYTTGQCVVEIGATPRLFTAEDHGIAPAGALAIWCVVRSVYDNGEYIRALVSLQPDLPTAESEAARLNPTHTGDGWGTMLHA